MSEVNFNNSPFYYSNPYKNPLKFEMGNHFLLENLPDTKEHDAFLRLADRIAKEGKKFLFQDLEKQVDFVGKTAKLLDKGIMAVVGSVDGVVLLNQFLHLQLQKYPVVSFFPVLMKLLSFPITSFFIGSAVIQEGAELINLRRVGNFLQSIDSLKERPLAQLNWIRANFFVLHQGEAKKIKNYIDRSMPFSKGHEKEAKFDQIAGKVLQMKYEALKRRVSPGIAKEIVLQFNSISKGLRSFNKKVREKAIQKAHILMNSVTTQAKNKILIHVLGILAISISLLSMILFLVGLSGFSVLIGLGVISFSLVIMRFILEKGMLKKEVEKLYDRLYGNQPSSENKGPLSSAPIVARSA